MSGQAANSLFGELETAVRDRLTDWALPFELRWRRGQLESYIATLPDDLLPWRKLALAELVRMDLAQHWRRGLPVALESYLQRFPELGTPNTVGPEIIMAEVEARQATGQTVPEDELARRFPNQAALVQEFIHNGSISVQPRRDRRPAEQAPAAEPSSRTTGSIKMQSTRTNKPGLASGPVRLSGMFGDKDRYEILKELGGGGMGAVYLATDTKLKRQVALKVPHFVGPDSEEMLDRFLREAQLLATISHANLGVVYDVDEFNGIHFQTMEYIEGRSLASYIKSRRMTPKQAVTLVRKVALALAEAHRQGVVHRDLKPSNIMLTKRGEPKVIDFGLAVNVSDGTSRKTLSGTMMGTLHYMPIEQIDGKVSAIGPCSDIYSLGVVLYELIAGVLPFPGEAITEVVVKMMQGAPLLTQHQPDLDPRLNGIVLKAIAKEPSDRYASMTDFAAALHAFLKSDKSGAPQAAGSSNAEPGRAAGETDISPETADWATTDDDEAPLAVSFFDQLRQANSGEPSVNLSTKGATASSTKTQRSDGSSNAPAVGLASILNVLPEPLRKLVTPSSDQNSLQRRTLLIALAAMGVIGLYGVILWFRSGDALVKVEVLSDDVVVTFQNETLTLKDAAHEFKLTPGKHRLHIKSDDIEFETEVFTLKQGDNPVVTVAIVDSEVVAKAGNEVLKLQTRGSEEPSGESEFDDSGTELLTNGGCEEPLDDKNTAGWKTISGSWTRETEGSAPFEGKACFRPGPAWASELTQSVPLWSYRDLVENGRLEISFRGHVLSHNADNKARLIVEFRDKFAIDVVDSYDTGFMSLTRKWQEHAFTRTVPKTAGWIRVRLVTSLGKLEDRNVFFDSVSLKARPMVADPAPTTTAAIVSATPSNTEVLKNGSCEEPVVNGQLPGWKILSGKWYACKTNNIAQSKHGKFYFHPGPVALGELIQDVPLSEFGDQIDAGNIEVSFKGFVRSSPKYGDFAQVIIEFRDSENQRVFNTFDSKKIRNMRGWEKVSDTRFAPKGTRWVRVRLISTREVGGSNDGYYDDLSLQVRSIGLPVADQGKSEK